MNPSVNERENAFRNAGTFINNGLANYRLEVDFINTGTVHANSGTLGLQHGGTSTGGTFNVANGATLRFAGPQTFDAATVFTGTGTIEFTDNPSNTLPEANTISNGYGFPGLTVINTGTTTFTGSATMGRFNFVEGTIALPTAATLTVTGLLTLEDGEIFGSGAKVVAAGGLTIANSAFARLNTTELTNPAGQTGAGQGSGALSLIDGSSFINAGTFQAMGFGRISSSGSGNSFVNDGTFTRSSDTTAYQVNAPFINRGIVSVQTGTLEINGGTTSMGGSFAVAAGAKLSLQNASTYDFASAFSGAGTVEFELANFTQTGGTFYSMAGTW